MGDGENTASGPALIIFFLWVGACLSLAAREPGGGLLSYSFKILIVFALIWWIGGPFFLQIYSVMFALVAVVVVFLSREDPSIDRAVQPSGSREGTGSKSSGTPERPRQIDDEEACDDLLVDDLVKAFRLACPGCGTMNRIKEHRKNLRPICGDCGARLT